MASYLELLRSSAQQRASIVCFGLDPDLQQLPPSSAMLSREERIVQFYSSIIDAALSEPQSISALKPNYAYFAQYGFDGLRALKTLIERYKGKLPIILDAKRGDIGKSSEAYAKEAFGFWNADAVTLSPYMGRDSIQPFLERCKESKGAYVLVRTSNPSASDFQSIVSDEGKPLYLEVARKLARWHTAGLGAVVGATALGELEQVLWVFYDERKETPFLIPGVGAQGASAKETAETLRSVWAEAMPLHRINSSSAIAYAYKKAGTDDYVGAALAEIRRMNAEIGKI
ncbi:MAG: orotidine-5'-phosphate decarboxylase [Candidatus Micrarchaeota archaeon]|nr:orotidine-5'-phosphate decarboxylase [Candidatus Micrarchaeota archaeon]